MPTLSSAAPAADAPRQVGAQKQPSDSAPELRFEIDETYDRIEKTKAMFADARVRQDLDD